MKKILKSACLPIILSCCLYSCNPKPVENYKGGIVYEKNFNGINKWFEIKYINNHHKYAFKRVYVLDFDYNKYNLGDTIK